MSFFPIPMRTIPIGNNASAPVLVCHLFHVFRVTLRSANGTIIMQTNGTEKVYDPNQAKTVNPFLAYTMNGTVTSVSYH